MMMSTKSKILAGVLLLSMGLFSACSSADDVDDNGTQSKSYKIVSPLRISVKSVSAQVASPEYHKIWDGDFPSEYKANIPADLSYEEKSDILETLKTVKASESVDCPYTNYFIQNVGCVNNAYTTTPDQNGYPQTVYSQGHMDYLVINGMHINDYNSNWGPTAVVLNLPVQDATYHDTWGDKDNTKTGKYIVYWSEKYQAYYLCFDYATAKNSGETFAGDGIYNDWVVKLTPADGNVIKPTPVDPEPEKDNVFEALQDDFRIVSAGDVTVAPATYEAEGIKLSVEGSKVTLDASEYTGEDGKYELKLPFTAHNDAEVPGLEAKLDQLVTNWAANTFFGMESETLNTNGWTDVNDHGVQYQLFTRNDKVNGVVVNTEFRKDGTAAHTYLRVAIPINKGAIYDIQLK
jgi:hypothetical protein